MKDRVTIKIWKDTRRKLKLLSAMLDKSMMECIDELIEEELKKQDKKKEETKTP